MKLLSFIISFILFLIFVPLASADKPTYDTGDVPEKNGVYPDPKNKDIRVRVFVHEPKEKITTSINNACTDPNSNASVGTTGWHLPSSVTYRLNTSSVPSSIGGSRLTTLAQSAFQTWSASVGGKVIFTRGTDTTVARSSYDGQNVVAWGRTSGNALGVTYTRYYTSNGIVVDVDTIMNKKFVWNWTDPSLNACSLYTNSYDAQDILTHELGHWMGLDDEYSSAHIDNTMYGYGSKGELKKNTLTSGDTTNLNTLY